MVNVLLVEDEKLLLEKMHQNIDWEKNNYKVFTAVNGKKAFKIIKKKKPEIIVTDIKIPGINGIELIKKSRKLNYKFIPIIISGYAEFEYAQESIHLNVEEYILKPFQSFRLLQIVNEAKKKLQKEKMEEKEINNLKKKLQDVNINSNSDNDLFSEVYNNEVNFGDIYDKQDYIFLYEDIFKVVKSGTKQEISKKVSNLIKKFKVDDINKKEIKIIIQNILLLIFNSLKDYGYSLNNLFQNIELNNYRDENIKIIQKWLLDILLQINNYITKNKIEKDKKLILKVNQIVKDNYKEGITLSSLAQKFNVSNSYLSKLFYEKNEVKFSTYIDNLRLQKAKELLKVTNYKIYEIAREIGFDDPYYFSSWFKKHIGISPTKYRKNINMLNE